MFYCLLQGLLLLASVFTAAAKYAVKTSGSCSVPVLNRYDCLDAFVSLENTVRQSITPSNIEYIDQTTSDYYQSATSAPVGCVFHKSSSRDTAELQMCLNTQYNQYRKSCGRTSDLMNNNRDYYCLCYDVSCKPAPIAPSSYWYSRFPSISEVYVLFFADHELAVVLFICCVQ